MSASCQWRYRARPVCLTMHTPSAITISVDGDGMIPADANDSGWQDRSAAERGRKPPRPSSKTSTGVLAVHPDAAPAVDLVPQVPGAGQLDQAALVRAPPQRQQRRLWAGGVGEEQGQAAPGLGGVHQPGVVGGPAFAPAAGLAVALYVEVDAGRTFDVGE